MIFFRKEKKDPKHRADDCFAKGQWESALEAYEEAQERDGADVKVLRRVADLQARLGRTDDAVKAYRSAAELYASMGFLVQAIAIYKILARLDPSSEELGLHLAELYAERGVSAAGGMPKIPFFSDLPAEVFAQALSALVSHELGPGDYLFRQGEPGDSFYVIASGSVEVALDERIISKFAEGEFFGEDAYFTREHRNADVRAGAEGAELLELRRHELESLMAGHQGVGAALKRFYRKRIMDRMVAASELMSGLDAEARNVVQECFEPEEIASGQTVITEGDVDRVLYFITRGIFSVSMDSPAGGGRVELARLGPGQFFGEVTVLCGGHRAATVRAVEPAEVLKADGEALSAHMERFPALRATLEKARDERAAAAISKILGRNT